MLTQEQIKAATRVLVMNKGMAPVSAAHKVAEMAEAEVLDLVKTGNVGDDDDGGNIVTLTDEQLRQLLSAGAATHKMAKGMRSELDGVLKHMGELLSPNRPSGIGIGGNAIDLGAMVAKSEQFAAVFGGGRMLNKTSAARAELGHIMKAITTGATGVPDTTRLPGIVPGQPPLSRFAFQRFAPGIMTGGVMEYVQDTSAAFDPSVPPTLEGALKPNTEPTFVLRQGGPKTIAHWCAASKQILADSAALGGYINTVLLYRLSLRIEWQTLMGDGLLNNMAGVYTGAADAGAAVAGDTPVDTIAKAAGVVNASGWACDTAVINPIDYTSILLAKGDDGHYTYGDPNSSTLLPRALWGMEVVPSPVMPVGKYLVGAFGQGAQLFEREGANVQAGFQNDDFTRNLVTLLAEARLLLATYALSAFRKGSL